MTEQHTVTLNEQESATLAALLDAMIPPSDDGRLPGAGEYDMWDYICSYAPEHVEKIRSELTAIAAACESRHAMPLPALEAEQVLETLGTLQNEDDSFMVELGVQVLSCYYQQDRVLEAIGMEARAPYPKGYTLEQGDFSLLDPVRKRGKIYREVD